MHEFAELIEFLKRHGLRLATAESCTCGLMTSLLADHPGTGKVLDCGLVTYSVEAKQGLLGVKTDTIERFGLTSEEVAREMAMGALLRSFANLAVANTGVADDQADDPQGTQCYAYVLYKDGDLAVVTETVRFDGDRVTIREQAARYALLNIPKRYAQLIDQLERR